MLPHGKLSAIDDNILTVTGDIHMPLMDLPRRMTVVRLNDARLIVYSAIALDEALPSSMKSRVNMAPELPPPPYTSATITPGLGMAPAAGAPTKTPREVKRGAARAAASALPRVLENISTNPTGADGRYRPTNHPPGTGRRKGLPSTGGPHPPLSCELGQPQ